ncbi:hypothetical protein [uncultured Dokdonia sp.]|uniref:hypothetical protein n=1 Tax=uncultured Dokdonia sp. TaxID=575653 RepID=UPI00260683DB|nr:hypothetical protein [uncultured Dokdonia sp.]
MGLRNDIDSIIVIESINSREAVSIIHEILINNKFSIQEDKDFSSFSLAEVLDDEHLPENYDETRCVENVEKDLEVLKSHDAGGTIVYENNNFNLYTTYKSLDDKNIDGIIFQADSYFVNTDYLDAIIENIINSKLRIVGITKGINMLHDLDIEIEMEKILSGNINKKYEYIVS